jgi:hypothetical protein
MSDKKSAGNPAQEYLSPAALRRRGWTDGMVRTLLGAPDKRVRNPLYQGAASARLYGLDRIEAAEQSERFPAVAEQAARRSAASLAAANRRREVVLRHVATVELSVPEIASEVLTRRAVRHRTELTDRARLTGRARLADRAQVNDTAQLNDRAEREGRLDRTDVSRVDPLTLERWKVNYLRHQLTDYDHFLDDLFGLTGKAEATRLLRIRVYAAIGKAYPDLAAECRRQLSARAWPP